MGPGQTTPGKSNSTTSLSTGNETERWKEREGEREREESLHFTEKASVNTSQKWERGKHRILSFFLSRDYGWKTENREKKTEGERRDECWPLLSYAVYFSHVCWMLITPPCLNKKKAAHMGTLTLSFYHMRKNTRETDQTRRLTRTFFSPISLFLKSFTSSFIHPDIQVHLFVL